ncbi:MAG: hypothetical protein H7122_06280 [Chitinophagaceae bacterium]|nr:hypothetical protein [Chitinophagaceae bacterium]
MLRRFFDFLIFSSLFIAGCAVIMVYQVNDIFQLHYPAKPYLWFVFFSTICSYNFHWYFTPHTASENRRIVWTHQHKGLHLLLILVGCIGAFLFFLQLAEYWKWIGISVILTFLYSAPKLPFRPAQFLRKIAVGKTIFLSTVWMYVTSALPIILSGEKWGISHLLFCMGRFFLIYAICIIFDFRDREQDKLEGIKSMITVFTEKGINILFYSSIIVFLLSTIALYFLGLSIALVILLLGPGLIVGLSYRYMKKNFSDYLYYCALDGMMAFSALLTSFLPF